MDKQLRAYYIRQLKKVGWTGNAGGWVFGPAGTKVQGWDWVLNHIARSVDRFGRALQAAR